MRSAIVLLFLALAPLAAHANTPSELKPLFSSQKPYGQAAFTYLWMDVYQVTLWTDHDRWQPDGRYALSITYHMGFSAAELVDRTCDEMQRHTANASSLCEERRDQLLLAMPGVKEGDRITAIRTDKGEARFFKNGAPTTSIDAAGFADAFFAIWLGENTSEPALRNQLLGYQ